MQENRKERFKRLATYRTNSILDKMRLLGNLSNRANYDYSSEEIEKIFRAIQNQLNETKAKFKNTSEKKFSL